MVWQIVDGVLGCNDKFYIKPFNEYFVLLVDIIWLILNMNAAFDLFNRTAVF